MLKINGYDSAKEVFDFFAKISAVPRPSGLTGHIADYLVAFAKERGLEFIRDKKDNVIIKKGASAGYEDRPTVIIQGHTDIVAEKTPEKIIDMQREGLDIFTDGDFIKADRTTLGADDGIAVAYMLALLNANNIPHPALECVFTSDEEIGLLGAAALDAKRLSGHTMINIDSDVEGVFTVGCAGGMRLDISAKDLKKQPLVGKKCYKIEICGLIGGHSGIEIDKGRINANKFIASILKEIPDILLCEIHGGNADNAIPREAYAIISSDKDILPELKEAKEKYLPKVSAEGDGNIIISEANADCHFTKEDSEKIISLICEAPNGVVTMSSDIEGLVQTSLNLGILRIKDEVNITYSLRSSKNKEKSALRNQLFDIAKKYGMDSSTHGEYPAWEYNKGTHLEGVLIDTYKKMYGKEPKVMTIHAGLECGIFAEKIAGLECVSLGPDNFDIHTPEERLSISSSARVWEFLLNLLKEI